MKVNGISCKTESIEIETVSKFDQAGWEPPPAKNPPPRTIQVPGYRILADVPDGYHQVHAENGEWWPEKGRPETAILFKGGVAECIAYG